VSITCDEAAEAVTRSLGFSCHDVAPVVSVRNPADLYSWTQPVLELVVIGGAIAALVLAIQRLRRDGDPINLSLWFASLAYLAITEPPLYFPEWFGLDEIYGFIFAHNGFTVQLMYDRLPLYIAAFYPAITALSYEVVRAFGIFARRGALVGAVCVGFVAQVFYEIFDHLGPQLKWWAWNVDNFDVNHPMLASVPMKSMLLFASVSLAFTTYLVVTWVGGRQLSGLSLAGRTVAAGVLTPLAMVVFGIPSAIFGGDTPNITAQAWVLGTQLAIVWVLGIWLLARDARQIEPLGRFVAVFPAVFLVAHAVFWIAALPAFVDAENGVTEAGTPIGSGWYVIACFVAAIAILVMLYRKRTTTAGTVA